MSINELQDRIAAYSAAHVSVDVIAPNASSNVDPLVGVEPSLKRLLLAWLLDLNFFYAFYGLATFLIVGSPPSLILMIIPFFVIELFFVKLRLSLGYRALSMCDVEGTLVVDPSVKRRECWPVMILATLLFAQGTESVTSSMMTGLGHPIFGFEAPMPFAAALDVLSGGIMILVAYQLYHVTRLGWILVLVGSVYYALDTFFSMSLIREYAHKYTAMENRTRASEVPLEFIDFVTNFTLIFMWASCAVACFVVLAYSERFFNEESKP